MTRRELEEWYIRSLDVPMNDLEKGKFEKELERFPEMSKALTEHRKIRDIMALRRSVSFGPYFASKLMLKMERTGIVIDRQIFSFFKKFQLAVAGVIVVLIVLNVLLTDQVTLKSIFGVDRSVTSSPDEADIPFDFFETLNKDL